MKVGDKVMCIKDFIRYKYKSSQVLYKFEKNKIYVINYVDMDKIQINVDNQTIRLSAYFWLYFDGFESQYYFYDYFINNIQIRRLKLDKLKMCND